MRWVKCGNARKHRAMSALRVRTKAGVRRHFEFIGITPSWSEMTFLRIVISRYPFV
jgi:hypothetical protein